MRPNYAPRVRYQGVDYFVIGDLVSGGAVATEQQYRTGAVPFAHLFPDGRVMQFGVQIATLADLDLLPEAELPTPEPGAFLNTLSWGFGIDLDDEEDEDDAA